MSKTPKCTGLGGIHRYDYYTTGMVCLDCGHDTRNPDPLGGQEK